MVDEGEGRKSEDRHSMYVNDIWLVDQLSWKNGSDLMHGCMVSI